ncbi:MAG: hypothetical protein V2A73_17160, partial [Pseudomonadota bacterium]
MRVRKFEAKTMRDAIAEVKRTLGPDAMILSARQVRRGLLATSRVEVTAAVDVAELDGKASPPRQIGGDTAAATVPVPRFSASESGSASGSASASASGMSARLGDLDVERIVGKVIRVEMNAVSEIDRRLLMAAAGGNPPDVAGV